LVAYQKFGMAMFEPGIEVRHKNNVRTNNRHENILGTHHDNMIGPA
jgi:HNH endonuclease